MKQIAAILWALGLLVLPIQQVFAVPVTGSFQGVLTDFWTTQGLTLDTFSDLSVSGSIAYDTDALVATIDNPTPCSFSCSGSEWQTSSVIVGGYPFTYSPTDFTYGDISKTGPFSFLQHALLSEISPYERYYLDFQIDLPGSTWQDVNDVAFDLPESGAVLGHGSFGYVTVPQQVLMVGHFDILSVSVGSPVSPVPKADAYALLLAGLGLMGFVMRHRHRAMAHL